MANNKKVFTIEINGITESIKGIDALQDKIDALNKSLKGLGGKGFEIPVEFDVQAKDLEKKLNTIKKKVNKTHLAPQSEDAEYNKLLADRAKRLAEVSREMANTNKTAREFKQETKDLVAAELKARNEAKTYANTMRGLKEELKDLKEYSQNLELGSDEYLEVSRNIYALTQNIKDLEEAQGTFGRNVGNYSGSMKDFYNEIINGGEKAKAEVEELANKWKEVYNAIDNNSFTPDSISTTFSFNELNSELDKLRKAMDNAVGQDDVDRIREYYDALKLSADGFKRMRGEVVKADNQLKTQWSSTIGGNTYVWETTTSAIGEMEDKLYKLASQGRTNEQEFKDLAKEAAKLKTAIRQVDYQIDAMTESSKGIMKMVSMAEGFTAMAQGAQGIGQLFGMGDSENAMRGIQTMTALQGIVMALQTLKQQMKDQTAFGKMMEGWIEKFTILSRLFKDFEINWDKVIPPVDITNKYGGLDKGLDIIIRSSRKFRKEYNELIELITSKGVNLTGGLGTALFDILNALNNGDIDIDTFEELTKKVKDFSNSVIAMKPNNKFTLWWTVLMSKFNDFLVASPKIAKGFKTISLGIKSILASTGILLLINLVIELIGWISGLVEKLGDWAFGNDKLVNSLNKVETEIDLVNKSISRYNRTLEYLKNTNRIFISDTEEATLKLEKLETSLLKATAALIKFNGARGGSKSLENSTKNDDYTWFGKASDIDGIEDATERLNEFKKVYFELMEAVESGNDESGKRGEGWWNFDIFNWFTTSDAKSDLGEMQQQIIKDLQYQINNIDLSKGTEAVREFYELLQDPMYATALANIENLFPEEEWAQVLKKRIEQVQAMYEQFDEAAKESAELRIAEEKRITKELVDYQTRITKSVRDNNVEAIKDEKKRELEALKNAKRDELDAAEGNLELIVSINKKYNRLEMDMLKKHNQDIADKEYDLTKILRQIRDNHLSAEEESLDKHLQELENERNDAIEDAQKEAEDAAREGRDLTEVYNKLVLSINVKYDNLIKKEKENYYKTLLEEYEKYSRQMAQLNLDMRGDELDNKSNDVDINYNAKLNNSEGSFDFTAQYGKLINEEKKFNQFRLQMELDYLEDKKKLDEEYAKFDYDDLMLQEKNRYADSLKELENFKKEGNATEEEYNKLVEKENELHKQTLVKIEQKYNNDLTTINNNYLNDRKSTISTALAEQSSLYQQYVNDVNDILSEVGQKKNAFGIVDYSASKEQFDKAKEVVKDGIANIDAELASLERKRKSKQISFIDYKQTKQDLEKTKKELEKQGKEIEKSMTELLEQVASSWKGIVDSWVGQISSLLTTMNDTQMLLIENEMAEIDRQLEIQEEAYEKAEEAAQEHKDKMDSIEDELADARGARRQFLIDTLAAQQAAYLEDVAAQQKAEEEKEKLEIKQQALEKKRKEQDKKAKVQQAVINTYMAVSNALSVSPWFVGLALSAVALALGMKNVAAIKSTPVYEDGGVIVGARHSQGGVKVLGGQAEVEGGEFITNRKSTSMNLPLLTYINDNKRQLTAEDLIKFFNSGTPTVKSNFTKKFASGGQLPTTNGAEVNKVMPVSDANDGNKIYVVQVTDIINAQKNLEKVQVLSGLVNE